MAADIGLADRPQALGSKLNWLRAGVLGANDGIVSVAGLVMGVAGATDDVFAILVAGLAGLIAGALSMAGGEYVSVSTQRDTEVAALDRQRRALDAEPERELRALAQVYCSKGISAELSLQVASELSAKDALAAHAEAELGIDSSEQVSPWLAAVASAIAFTLGALIPLLVVVLTPGVLTTVGAVLFALALTGYVSARLGDAPVLRPILRNLAAGTLAMGLAHGVGVLVGSGIG
ncbi:MAG: VIT family protein [Propionibacteriaceae bacterium]|nr:VIT family protein [Propionibacteriaceae bacterium]